MRAQLPRQPLVVGTNTSEGSEQEVKEPLHRFSGIKTSLGETPVAKARLRAVVEVDVAVQSLRSERVRIALAFSSRDLRDLSIEAVDHWCDVRECVRVPLAAGT